MRQESKNSINFNLRKALNLIDKLSMKFKTGEIVIKTTGGNKMTIFDSIGDVYKCIWFVESKLNESEFKEEEIVSLQEYKRILKTEEREDKLNQLFNSILAT